MSALNVRVGLHVEEVEGTLLVLDPTSSKLFELAGDQAEAFRLAQAGVDLVPDHLAAALAGLVELGLVVAPGWSRRRLLLAGGAVTAAAVVAVALPSPAAAQSAPGGGGPVDPPEPTVPGPPTVEGVRVLRTDRVYEARISRGDDGGSPILGYRVFVNGLFVTPSGINAFFPARRGDKVQATAINAIGEGPLSDPYTIVT